jgi:site-specific DNA-methyltransferase (adenine-specific)
MKPVFEDDRATIFHGDCAEVIASLPDASVDCVVTSPPYAEQRATTYGGIPESEYPQWTALWMEPLKRVLKPRGSVIINIRPHVHKGVISDYTLHTRLLLRTCGWSEIEELIWFKKGGGPPLGHVGRPRRSWESLHWFGLSGDVWCDTKANGAPSESIGGLTSCRAATAGWNHLHGPQNEMTSGMARSLDVAELATRLNPNDCEDTSHPAPYPPKLAAWCIRLVCPPGGTVLDPFSGSGSTGVAAIQEGRRYVGIDLAEEYAAMSARRVAKEPPTLDIFGQETA